MAEIFETNVEESLKRCGPKDVEYSITIVLQVNEYKNKTWHSTLVLSAVIN